MVGISYYIYLHVLAVFFPYFVVDATETLKTSLFESVGTRQANLSVNATSTITIPF